MVKGGLQCVQQIRPANASIPECQRATDANIDCDENESEDHHEAMNF